MKIGLISVGFPNFRHDVADEYLKISIKRLTSMGYDLICKDRILIKEDEIEKALKDIKKNSIDLLIVQCGTYSYGSAIVKVIEEYRYTPLLLWGFREPVIEGFRGLPLNSLCCLNMYASFLRKAEKEFSYVYGNVNEEQVYKRIYDTIRSISVKKKLKESKFCVIGSRVPGFYLSNVDELRFRFEIGPEIKYYSLAELLHDANNVSPEEVTEEVAKMKNEVACITTTDEMLEKSARIYIAIKNYKKINSIDAFAIKCWPEFQSLYNCSVCGVVSRLNNEGIITSCEGDIPGLATMYIQYLVTGQPCFFADLVNINEEGIAKVWHCGPAPICMAESHCTTKYIEHPTIGQGMGFATEFKMKLGKLVVLKLKEDKEGYKLFMAKGTGVEVDRDMSANQADIRFDTPAEKVIETIMDNGIEHHYAIVYQDIEEELSDICKWIGIDIIKC